MNRQISGWMVAASLAAGLALYCPFGILAATDRQGKPKENTTDRQDAHLIRRNDEALDLRKQVDAATKKAFEHGYHACCISPPCSWCLLHLGQCICAIGVGGGRYACRECHGGWEGNQGRIPGKTKNDVRKMRTISIDFMSRRSGAAEAVSGAAGSDVSGAAARTPVADAPMVASGTEVFNSQN